MRYTLITTGTKNRDRPKGVGYLVWGVMSIASDLKIIYHVLRPYVGINVENVKEGWFIFTSETTIIFGRDFKEILTGTPRLVARVSSIGTSLGAVIGIITTWHKRKKFDFIEINLLLELFEIMSLSFIIFSIIVFLLLPITVLIIVGIGEGLGYIFLGMWGARIGGILMPVGLLALVIWLIYDEPFKKKGHDNKKRISSFHRGL